MVKKWLLWLPALFLVGVAWADHERQVAQLVAASEAPPGVVFEIVSRQKDFLDWALPEARAMSRRLRQRFPELAIAVVSHGREQFALMQARQAQKPQVHSLVQALTGEENVDVHVCGTFAEMNDVAAEAFPDYVNVAAAGPAQINDYKKLGYVHIKIRRP